VARWTTDSRLGQLGVAGVTAAVVLGSVALWARARHRLLSRFLASALVAVLLFPAVALRRPGPSEREIVGAGILRRNVSGTALTLATDARAASALRALRADGIMRLDVIALPTTSAAMEAVVAVIERRVRVQRVETLGSEPSG
jgi:hypothetical protein